MTRRLIGPRDLPDGHPARRFVTGRTPVFASGLDQRFSSCVYVPDQGPASFLTAVLAGSRA
jgi:hypothetical protein